METIGRRLNSLGVSHAREIVTNHDKNLAWSPRNSALLQSTTIAVLAALNTQVPAATRYNPQEGTWLHERQTP